MDIKVTIDWKSIATTGAAVTAVICASKLDSAAAERVLNKGLDTLAKVATALNEQ